MKSILITLVAVVFFTSCAQTQATSELKFPEGTAKKPGAKEAVATFAEGCFWHTEIVFQSLDGVRDAVSGYAGGSDADPDYETVGSGSTGHAESVNVYYDPSKISFETLVKAFFASHDPTQANGQGNDIGSQYRSIAFYRNDAEKKIIEDQISKLNSEKKYPGKIVTEVKPFTKFYTAESYHQEYVAHHKNNVYVANVSIPEFRQFRATFKDGKFKN